MSLLKLIGIFVTAFSCFGQWIESNADSLPSTQVQEFLKLICPTQTIDSGCDVCPHETSAAGSPMEWQIQTIYLGHFLSASSGDALVTGTGCEGHSSGMSGSYLFTRDGNSWRKVRYSDGTRANDCRKVTGSDGRDRLICSGQDGHGGILGSWLSLLDPGDPSRNDTAFFDLIDTTGAGACNAYAEDGDSPGDGSLTAASVDRVEFTTLPKNHQVQIVVFANEDTVKISSKLREQICAGTAPEPHVATKPTRTEFIFDGNEIH